MKKMLSIVMATTRITKRITTKSRQVEKQPQDSRAKEIQLWHWMKVLRKQQQNDDESNV